MESERHPERKGILLLYMYFFLHTEPLLLSGNEPRHESHMAWQNEGLILVMGCLIKSTEKVFMG